MRFPKSAVSFLVVLMVLPPEVGGEICGLNTNYRIPEAGDFTTWTSTSR